MRDAIFALFLATGLSAGAGAQDLIIYKTDTTPEQTAIDRQQCEAWAIEQLGYSPSSLAGTAPPATAGTQGAVIGGAMRGAIIGGVVGEIANNDFGDGAETGAALGAAAGVGRRRQARRQQQHAQAQHNADQQARIDTYWRAVSTCLQGRGYTVS